MRFFLLSTFFLVSCKTAPLPEAVAPNPNLIISTSPGLSSAPSSEVKISLNELKKQIGVEIFEVKNHPVYGEKTVHYQGFKFDQIVSHISRTFGLKNSQEFVVSVWATDNFSSFITQEDLKTGKSFLAFQEKEGGFTEIPLHGNPGPYYLVWDNPKVTYWQKWPFKVAEISLIDKKTIEIFKPLQPSSNSNLLKGYRLAIKNCTACHQIQKVGLGKMGPGLDWLADDRTLPKFLDQVRKPYGKMIAFSQTQLSDEDVAAIYHYLKSIK